MNLHSHVLFKCEVQFSYCKQNDSVTLQEIIENKSRKIAISACIHIRIVVPYFNIRDDYMLINLLALN